MNVNKLYILTLLSLSKGVLIPRQTCRVVVERLGDFPYCCNKEVDNMKWSQILYIAPNFV